MTGQDDGSTHCESGASAGVQAGRLFVVSAPSGAGKSTLCSAVRHQMPELAYSISHTTRAPRTGETDGREYHFIAEADFEQGIARGRWAEWAQVHGNYYGSSARWIRETLAQGSDILMDIDVQGAQQILDAFPDAVTIFIMAPSMEALEQRLRTRATDDSETIALRLANAIEEMAHKERYHHVVVNDDLEAAIGEMVGLITQYRVD